MTTTYEFYLDWCAQSQTLNQEDLPTFEEWRKAWEDREAVESAATNKEMDK